MSLSMAEMEQIHESVAVAEFSDEVKAQVYAAPAPHLVRLPGTRWALWRWAGLRGAGFPAAQVMKLGVPECAAAADALIEAEAEAEDARAAAVAAVRAKLFRSTGDERAMCDKALRRLSKGKLPDASALAASATT